MEEKLEEVVEETTQNNQQDPGDENVVKVDESKFEYFACENIFYSFYQFINKSA